MRSSRFAVLFGGTLWTILASVGLQLMLLPVCFAAEAGDAAKEAPPQDAKARKAQPSPAESQASPEDKKAADRILKLMERDVTKAEKPLRRGRRAQAEEEAAPVERGEVQVPWVTGPWAYWPGWGYWPWYGLPQTYYGDEQFPPRMTHLPRLGLQYNYPYAYQMGIHSPEDSDPLYVAPNMGPFVGVVGATKAALRQSEPAPGENKAVGLMKEGKFREAGRILAGGFQKTDDPRYPLLLAEVFFALGKPEHAEALLRQAVDFKGVEEVLPKEVSNHFPKPEEFDAKVDELSSGGNFPLLAGYLLVHSKSPERGLELLRKLASQDPVDPAAGLLYRHYLGKAFKE
jgi:hypothetical protein